MIPDPKFLLVLFRRHTLNGVVSQHRLGDIPLIPMSITDANRVVAMSLPCLVVDDLNSVEL
jgi:hypothetical protein